MNLFPTVPAEVSWIVQPKKPSTIHCYCPPSHSHTLFDFDKFEDDATPRRMDCSSVGRVSVRRVCFATIYRVLAFTGFVPPGIIIVNHVIHTERDCQLEKDPGFPLYVMRDLLRCLEIANELSFVSLNGHWDSVTNNTYLTHLLFFFLSTSQRS